MKKFITALLCAMLTFTVGAIEAPTKTKTFTVHGFFIAKAVVKYDLYRIEANGTQTLIETKTGFKEFNVNMNIGHKYLIVFTKGDRIKTLEVDALKPGEMELDVNFKSEKYGKLYYNTKLKRYELRFILPDEQSEHNS
jgi:hypothetical protein